MPSTPTLSVQAVELDFQAWLALAVLVLAGIVFAILARSMLKTLRAGIEWGSIQKRAMEFCVALCCCSVWVLTINDSLKKSWPKLVSDSVDFISNWTGKDPRWAVTGAVALFAGLIAAIIRSIAGAILVQKAAFKKVTDLTEALDAFKEATNQASDTINQVRETSLEDLRLATHTVATALSLRADPKIEQNSSSTIGRFYQTLGSAIDQWRTTAEQAKGPNEFDSFLNLRDVVLRLGACYLRQEAVAAEGKYVTTSGTNYVEMLISVVDELLRQIPSGGDYKVHYVAVTTASPLDFYNWKNRGIDGAGRWEAPYLRLFRHTLHALIHDDNLKDRIDHSRIVMTAKDEAVVSQADLMSWELSLDEDIQSDLQTKIFPMPFEIPENIASLGPSDVAANLFTFLHHADAAKRKAFLVFSTKLDGRWLNNTTAVNAKRNLDFIEKNRSGEILWDNKKIIDHVEALRVASASALTKTLTEFEENIKDISLVEYDAFKEALSISGKTFVSLNKIYEFWARLRSALALKGLESNLPKALKLLEGALEYHLSFREAVRISTKYASKSLTVDKWPTMEEVFRDDWHSSTGEFTRVRLEATDLENARTHEMWQEFALFGIGKKGDPVKWVFGLATDLEYPFDYERVDFLMDGSSALTGGLSKYVKWFEYLKSK